MSNEENMNIRPSNDNLIDTLFGDMKKMHSIIERLQKEINELRNTTENVPKDVKMMDSLIKDLTRQVHELKHQLRDCKKGKKLDE